MTINELPEEVKKLKHRKLFERIFEVANWYSNFSYPKRKDFEHQTITYIENKVTGESAIFNPVRARRPQPLEKIKIGYAKDAFRKPGTFAPIKEEVGPLENDSAVLNDNLAKIAKWHGLLVFKRHAPFNFSSEELYKGFLLSKKWFEKVAAKDKRAKYPLIFWNNLPRAGASQIHTHWQLTATPVSWIKQREFREALRQYSKKYKTSYMRDLITISKELGLCVSFKNSCIILNLTPVKEKEIMLVTDNVTEDFFRALVRTLKVLEFQSFNMVIDISQKPYMARVVDRGTLSDVPSDIGAMELYAAPVVSHDPFELKDKLYIISKKHI